MRTVSAALGAIAVLSFGTVAQAHTRTVSHAPAGKPVPALWGPSATLDCPQTQAITVINQANVRPDRLALVERAVEDQSVQVSAAWGTPCITFAPGGWRVVLRAGSPEGLPFGQHGNDPVTGPDGNPVNNPDGSVQLLPPDAVIWTTGVTYTGWSGILSHETIEMLVDPYGRRWVGGCPPTDAACDGSQSVQACDPVEHRDYLVGSVPVADFTLPSYWYGGAGPRDEMRVLAY